MIKIDGSFGEGGGQILRSALALSLITGKGFTIENIRAKRKNPGLARQHVTCVRAAARIGSAMIEGAQPGSMKLVFEPQQLLPGTYRFSVGTAGSTTLVLQTVLPALLCADGPSSIIVEGGTHNPMAPPFDFIEKVFVPVLRRMGAELEVKLEKAGFYPAGGGRIVAEIKPVEKLRPLFLASRGEVKSIKARAVVSQLPRSIADRELSVVRRHLDLKNRDLFIEEVEAKSPGNVVFVEVESAGITELFVGFGEKRLKAEKVAKKVCKQVQSYLDAEVPVGEHLADQLLLPYALAQGGSFKCLTMSDHTRTNIDTIKKFVDVNFVIEDELTAPFVVVEPS